MPRKRADLLQGTLDLLVMRALSFGPLHGWAISKRIRERSEGVLEVNQGSLYPALYRLEERGWIEAREAQSPEGRRIREYSLTVAGRHQLHVEREEWRLFTSAVNQVLS